MTRPLPGVAALAALSLLAGCDAATDDTPASLSLVVDARVGAQALSTHPNTLYSFGTARATLASARLYISEITLLKADGESVRLEGPPITLPAKTAAGADTTITVTDRIVLARSDMGETTYTLGEAPAGRYTGVRFKVGIDGVTNRVDATQAPAGSALAKQTDTNNHWSWNAGYIFARLDGVLDLNGDGQPDSDAAASWNVHLGTSGYVTDVALSAPFTLRSGDAQALTLVADYARLMQGVDLTDPAQRVCHTMNNVPVATKVKANVPVAFTLTGVE